ncbi:hypothetical protein PG997_000925 [Apiospora hydei]|uniref:Uncharacterized protein n=1 Tax=Apiospora hydei TaxID=1337664 RepID=A0ABR1XC18_9PEZI
MRAPDKRALSIGAQLGVAFVANDRFAQHHIAVSDAPLALHRASAILRLTPDIPTMNVFYISTPYLNVKAVETPQRNLTVLSVHESKDGHWYWYAVKNVIHAGDGDLTWLVRNARWSGDADSSGDDWLSLCVSIVPEAHWTFPLKSMQAPAILLMQRTLIRESRPPAKKEYCCPTVIPREDRCTDTGCLLM